MRMQVMIDGDMMILESVNRFDQQCQVDFDLSVQCPFVLVPKSLWKREIDVVMESINLVNTHCKSYGCELTMGGAILNLQWQARTIG